MDAPTDKQIDFANAIANALGLDFPTGSPDFNKWVYWTFVSENIERYRELLRSDPAFEDDEMAWFDPFVEGGY